MKKQGGKMEIPKQLQNKDFRFVLLGKWDVWKNAKTKERRNVKAEDFLKYKKDKNWNPKGKAPIEDEWQTTNNYKYDDKKLLAHIGKGLNYGIIGGFGNLILIDADSKEINERCKLLPKTFKIKTGSSEEYKNHYYFFSDEPLAPIRFTKEKVGDIGDIRSFGQYVVAPNSIHPEGNSYVVIKDIPIQKVSCEFLKTIFKDYIDVDKSTKPKDKKDFKIDTTKRLSQFTKNCRVPDFVLNNKLPDNISKNWELFPYIIDVLNARDVSDKLYERMAEMQEHDIGAVKGWVKMAKEGKLTKCSCKKMRKYMDKYIPELKEEICGECPLYKKIEEEKRKDPANIFSRIGQAKAFIIEQPMFYDRKGLWWKWNFNKYCYEIVDETDILNSILKELNLDTTTSKPKTEILNSLKQVGRMNIPEEAKTSWVQFGKKIIDIETDEEFKATPEYFVTNPIPHKLGKKEDTPEIDKLFVSWVGEEIKIELYETLAFCCVPEYFIHRIICLIGRGANGKSTFLNLLKRFIGIENITSSNLKMLMISRFEGSKLYKKLVCLMGETNFNIIKDTGFLKSATGEDTLRGEFKGKNPFDFISCAKWLVATNTLPMTQDKTDGYYRRWKIIDFLNKFKKEKDVLSKIPEEEYENLCLKCLNIMKRLYKERVFTNDGSFEERRKRYEDKSNPVMLFINEHYERDINEQVLLSDFYDFLKDFLENFGYRELTIKNVSTQLKNEGFDIKKLTINSVTGRWIIGLKNKLTHKNTSNTSNTSKLNRSSIGKTSENCGISGICGIVPSKLQQTNLDKTPIKPQDFK